jgi:hypothetical protein
MKTNKVLYLKFMSHVTRELHREHLLISDAIFFCLNFPNPIIAELSYIIMFPV